MPRKRASKIRRAIQAAIYEQNRNLRREHRAAIQPQAIPVAEPVAEPQVAAPQVAEIQVAEPQVAEIQAAEPQAIPARILNWIQELYRRIPPQLLPPIEILSRQAAGDFRIRIPNVFLPVPPQQEEEEDVLQLAHEDEA